MTKFKVGQVWQCRDQCLLATITTVYHYNTALTSIQANVERNRAFEQDDWTENLDKRPWNYSSGENERRHGQAATFCASDDCARKMDLMQLLYEPETV